MSELEKKEGFKYWLNKNRWIIIVCLVGLFAVSQCINSCSNKNKLRVITNDSFTQSVQVDSLNKVISRKEDTIKTLNTIIIERDKMIEELKKANSRPIKIIGMLPK